MSEINLKYFLYLKLLFVAFFFGGTYIAGKVLSETFPPFTSSFLRFFSAALFLLIYLAVTYYRKPFPAIDQESMLQIFLLALTGIVGYNFFFFSGLKLIDASRASMIVALNPASISVFSLLFFGEKLHPLNILGIILSFAGAILVITKGQLALLFNANIGIGECYILGCVICWTAFTLISKSVIRKIPPLVVITLACSTGAVILSIPAWREGYLAGFHQFDIHVWISLFVLALLGSVIAYIWYYEGIEKIGASRTAVFINFVPVSATAMAILILHERLTLPFIMGAIVVLSGVFLVNRRPKMNENRR